MARRAGRHMTLSEHLAEREREREEREEREREQHRRAQTIASLAAIQCDCPACRRRRAEGTTTWTIRTP